MNAITEIIGRIEAGETEAAADLLPLVYDELRRLAAAKLASESPGQTLQATALVHEAYVRLVDGGANRGWDSRGHFFGAAAEAMRRILVEQSRRKRSLKRGGDRQRQELIELTTEDRPSEDVIAVSEALDLLAQSDPLAADLVKLRFFAGLTGKEAAAALGVSVRTADRVWAYARSYLYCRLHDPELDG